MKTKIIILTTLVLLIVKYKSNAQETAPVQQAGEAAIHPPIGSFEADYSYSPFKINNKDVSIQQVNGKLTVPLYNTLKDGRYDFFLAGIGYNGLLLSGTGNQFGSSNFHSVSASLTWQKSFSPKYALITSFTPMLSSDLKDISGEDLTYSGAVLLKIRKSAKFSYSLGAVYSKQFFGTVLVPVVGIDWNISDKLTLSAMLPVSEKLTYQLSRKSFIGFNGDFGLGGGTYRLSQKMNSDYFQVRQVKTTLFYEYHLTGNFSVNLNAGYNFGQQLDLYAKDQKVNWVPFNNLDKLKPLEQVKKNGLTVQTGINYNF